MTFRGRNMDGIFYIVKDTPGGFPGKVAIAELCKESCGGCGKSGGLWINNGSPYHDDPGTQICPTCLRHIADIAEQELKNDK